MHKTMFDQHLEGCYDELLMRALARHGEKGEDMLHNGLESMYRTKFYGRLPQTASHEYVIATMAVALRFASLEMYRRASRDCGRRDFRGLIHYFDTETVNEYTVEPELSIDDKAELKADVRNALGQLSLEHYNLAVAHFMEGETVREIAKRTGQTVYRVFTEAEIVRETLKETLKDYRPIRVCHKRHR